MASRLISAAQDGDFLRVLKLLQGGTSASTADRQNLSALHVACDYGHFDVVKILVEAGANINAIDNFGRTPLYFAQAEGFKEIASFLIQRGALSGADLAKKMSEEPKEKKKVKAAAPVKKKQDTKENAEKVKQEQVIVAVQQVKQQQIEEKPRSRSNPCSHTASVSKSSSMIKKQVCFAEENDENAMSIEISDDNQYIKKQSVLKERPRSRSNPNRFNSPQFMYQPFISHSNFQIIRDVHIPQSLSQLLSEKLAIPDFITSELRERYISITCSNGKRYEIMTRYISSFKSVSSRFILLLHGFGACQTGFVWLYMVESLIKAGFNVILVDLPGFGLASGPNLNTKTWKSNGPEIIEEILNSHNIQPGMAHVLAFCGGAATFMRAYVKNCKRFAKRHVLHNCVTGEWEKQLDELLVSTGTKLYVTWNVDIDHSVYCVSYKHLAKLRSEKFPSVTFLDIDDDTLSMSSVDVVELSRCDEISFFVPSLFYIQQVIAFLNSGNI